MANNIKCRVRDGKLRITIDLTKPPTKSHSGKALVQAKTDGVFEQLGTHSEELQGYALSLTLLAPKDKGGDSGDVGDEVKKKRRT